MVHIRRLPILLAAATLAWALRPSPLRRRRTPTTSSTTLRRPPRSRLRSRRLHRPLLPRPPEMLTLTHRSPTFVLSASGCRGRIRRKSAKP